ncbi:hypothetical protein [Nocardia sp. NPDC049149]|uniref:hypothetical protein n=1 Tax=Nocardia sp. NPDC049149 TaxID=3364315 RepID=UPI003723F71D
MSTDDADTNKDAETAADTSVTEGDAAEKSDAAASAQPEPASAPSKADEVETAKADKGKTDKVDKVDTAKATKPAKSTDDSAPSGRSASLPLIAAFTAGVLAVAAITAVVVFFLQGKDRGDKLDAIKASTDAACTFGKDVSIYDYSKNLDDYFTKVKAGASGEFLKEFGDATSALKDAMVQAQVKSWADDVQCGYQSGDKTEANVLVTLTQYRTNFTQTNPERQFVVLIAKMTKSGDKWLVEKLDSPLLKGAGTGLPGTPNAPAPNAPAPNTQPAPAPSAQPSPQPGN